jgi:hypothetical protein
LINQIEGGFLFEEKTSLISKRQKFLSKTDLSATSFLSKLKNASKDLIKHKGKDKVLQHAAEALSKFSIFNSVSRPRRLWQWAIRRVVENRKHPNP